MVYGLVGLATALAQNANAIDHGIVFHDEIAPMVRRIHVFHMHGNAWPVLRRRRKFVRDAMGMPTANGDIQAAR